MTRRRSRDDNWSNVAIIAALAAMVVVMAVTALTLHRNSPLMAARPEVTVSEPGTTGEGGDEPLGAREWSVETYPDQRGRERPFVPLGPGGPRSSTRTP
jgi:hypothetical protein